MHLCLDELGRHTIAGHAYTVRHPHLVKVDSYEIEITASASEYSGNTVRITDRTLWFN
jgi:hypothetical protein